MIKTIASAVIVTFASVMSAQANPNAELDRVFTRVAETYGLNAATEILCGMKPDSVYFKARVIERLAHNPNIDLIDIARQLEEESEKWQYIHGSCTSTLQGMYSRSVKRYDEQLKELLTAVKAAR